jgi:hypothetical protein
MSVRSDAILDAWADANSVLGLVRATPPGVALTPEDHEFVLRKAASVAAFMNKLNAQRHEEARPLREILNGMRGFTVEGYDVGQTGPFLASVLSEMERRLDE